MDALVQITLPVFLVIGFGLLAVRTGLFPEHGLQGLMTFAQGFAIPLLLFRAMARIDLAESFDPPLLLSFYAGAAAGFLAGLLGARLLFRRPWPDSVAIGFVGLFSNTLLLGLPITERAYGANALGPNYAIIAFHSPFCYTLGVTAMEIARASGRGAGRTALSVLRSMARNPLVIGIVAGLGANLGNVALPGVLTEAMDLVIRAALPAALFALGGTMARYRPEGDMATVAWVVGLSLVLHPAVTWLVGSALGLGPGAFRSAVVTAAMAPGINTYIFADMYGVGRRVAATAVLVGTALSILTVSVWLQLLGQTGA